MIARLALACVAAAALTIAPALIEGKYLNRWGKPADMLSAAKQVEGFPREFGAWRFQSEGDQLAPMVTRELALSGYLTRSYVHRDRGDVVNVLLMVGQPGPLVRHPPNICYTNRANEQIGATTKFEVKSTTPPSEFSLLEFKRPDSVVNDRFLVAYALATGPVWEVPALPRLEFGASPLLYKVQFLQTLNPEQSKDSGAATLQQFANDFCAAFQKHLQSHGG
jgi:hypothetical protein